MRVLYLSFDVEADGNNPLQHSMRSVGVVCVTRECHLVDSFYATLEPREGTSVEPSCMREFWARHPEAWEEVHRGCYTPEEAMRALSDWLQGLRERHDPLPVCFKWLASPANFDWMFLKTYYEAFGPGVGKVPLGYFCHDLSAQTRTHMAMAGVRDRDGFQASLRAGLRPTHHALDDALVQAVCFLNLQSLQLGGQPQIRNAHAMRARLRPDARVSSGPATSHPPPFESA